jgi:hypothetical protein
MQGRKEKSMSEASAPANGHAPVTAATLFDLFKSYEDVTITDSQERSITVRLMSLESVQQERLAETLNREMLRARKELTVDEQAEMLKENLAKASDETLTMSIITMERPRAESLSDLAPNAKEAATPEERKQLEDDALKKWEEDRRKALSEESHASLVEIVFRRQLDQSITNRGITRWIDYALVEMVRDPATGARLLSSDPGAPNFVGKLDADTRRELEAARQKFTDSRRPKAIREVAKKDDFLSSGESPKKEDASPGEMIEIPSTGLSPS